MITVSGDSVRVGDEILSSVYDNRGILLVKRGTVVDHDVIHHLSLYPHVQVKINRPRKPSTKIIRSSDVIIGDYIAQDVINNRGELLVERGTSVDSRVLWKLRGYRGEVLITLAPEFGDTVEVEQTNLLELDPYIKKRVDSGISYIFDNPDADDAVGVALDMTNLLCDVIANTDAVGFDIARLKVSDVYTHKHSVDVSMMGAFIGKHLHYPRSRVREIAISGLLHDLGKADIPEEIIEKPGKLTDEERLIINGHPILGYNHIKNSKYLSEDAKMGILMHHEKWNGTGYCSGYKGMNINWLGRLLAVADVYDALVTERSYKKGLSPLSSVLMMRNFDGHFDKSIFPQFLSCLVLFPAGTKVTLSTGEQCIVIEHNQGYPFNPLLRSLRTGRKIDLLRDPLYRNIHIAR